MSYLQTKPGSLEEAIRRNDEDYQALFKKELEKTGKSIPQMTPDEKKKFFNKIDKMHSAKNEAKVDELTKAQKKLPPALQKAIKKKEENIDEKKDFTSQQIRQAYGIANDKRYKGGNLTGAVSAIEKIADGLSLHPDVLKVLKRTHEEVQIQKEDKEKVAQLKTKLSKEKDTDKLEAQITQLKGDLALARQQLENEKNKAIKPEPNPETGEVPLTVGVAYKHLRDKMKKEEEKKKNGTMTGKKPTKIDTKPEVEFDK